MIRKELQGPQAAFQITPRAMEQTLLPAVALDDRRLESLATQLRNLESAHSSSPEYPTALASFVTPCTAKPIRLGIQQRVEGLFNCPTALIASILPQCRGAGDRESAKFWTLSQATPRIGTRSNQPLTRGPHRGRTVRQPMAGAVSEV
jgi:hypothetical protein